jgi:hypothetical protein
MKISVLDPSEIPIFAEFTYPLFREIVTTPPDHEMLYIGATGADGKPLGLAFGMGGPRGEYEMISVYVSALFRNMGIGTNLTNALHDGFNSRDYHTGVQFYTADADDESYTRFLMRCGYSRPIVRQLVCKTTVNLAESTPWLRDAEVPDGYRIGLWKDVSKAARTDLKYRKTADPGLFPYTLDPFDYEGGCNLDTSVVLYKDEQIVGWIITHILDDETLRWTCSWVLTSIQGSGRIIPLWWEAVQRQKLATGLPRFTWTVPMGEQRMTRFAVRRMRPWLEYLGYACTALRQPTRSHDPSA